MQTTFNTAYSQNCGALSNDACNDKFLCQSGYDYVSNTATCKILASTVMGSFDTAYNQNCSNMAGTTNHDLCNDILLCKPGDDYLTNTDKCQTAACVPTNSACAANTYFGQSCWDGCAFIAGTKSYNCAGSIPAGYTMCASDDTGLTSNLSWLGAGATSSSCTAARKCEYYGSGGGGGGGSFACSGSIPTGYTMCASDDTGLTSNLPWLVSGATSSTCTAARKCEYYGSGGGGGGGSFACSGSIPTGYTMCAGDDTGLTSNLSWKQVTSCTGARKCEYVWNCAPNIVTPGFKECAP